MNWLKKKIIRWARNNWENAKSGRYEVEAMQGPGGTVTLSNSVDVDGLAFKVMPALGGVIVQLRKYNRKIDTENYTTYIIPEGEDISERVGQIVSMELLRH